MVGFIIGLMAGGFLGIVVMAMLSLAADADKHMKNSRSSEE